MPVAIVPKKPAIPVQPNPAVVATDTPQEAAPVIHSAATQAELEAGRHALANFNKRHQAELDMGARLVAAAAAREQSVEAEKSRVDSLHAEADRVLKEAEDKAAALRAKA